MRRLTRLVAAVLGVFLPVGCARAAEGARRPPNVLVILADDLGFSDLGCYGGEIDTPHLDRLAAGGLRYTQGYNTARCWPTRSALLTGYYAQAIRRDALPGGRGGSPILRPDWTPLLPDLLAPAGYVSYHSGKWHVDRDPRRQGFARSFEYSWMNKGTEDDYFDAAGVRVDGEPLAGGPDFYLTTAIGDHAVACLRGHAANHPGRPFFQYVAFTAPHFPLHAPQALVSACRERYRAGWDAVRAQRCRRVREAGIVTTPAADPEPDVGPPYQPNAKTLARLGPGEADRPLAWEALTPEQREFQATKMAIHAAMVEMMDRAVGAIVGQLEAMGALDDTLILFASDNGASAEIMIRGKGHDPTLPPGGAGTYLCLGPGWSTCANAPFRRHKTWVHEGGIATPWIVHWPAGVAARGELRTQPVHVIDVVPTVLELAGVAPPAVHDGKPVPPLQGRSFVASLTAATASPGHDSLWWCHEGNRAVRQGDWKLVAARGDPWELYDLAADRCETRNLAAAEPRRVADLSREWERIAKECAALAGPPAEFTEDPRFQEQMRRPRRTPPAAATVPFPAWWAGVQPDLVNEDLDGPAENPFKTAFRAQFGPEAKAAPAPAAAKRPNILVIVADDQSPFDLKAYDPAARLDTPVLDALAARGCVLDAAYHMGSFSGAVCTPSRHMLMTGRSLWHLPIGPGGGKRAAPTAGVLRRCPADIEDHVLAAVFNRAGYDTMRTCKEGNSYEGANRRFTVRHDATKRKGTAEGGSAWHADRVLDFLAARAASGDTDPFLVWYGFSHPHDTRDGPPELLAKYGATNHADESRPPPLHDRQPPLPASWLPRHPFDDTDMDVRDEVAVSGVWRRRDEATIRNELGRQCACSENIDVQIGRVIDRLRALGELDNTWILYTSDHGIAIGRHGLQGKQNLYEHTWRVPLIVAGPGVKPGSRAPGNVYLSDVLATLCDVAGIEPPATNEGTSFRAVLAGEQRKVRDVLYGAYSGGAKPGIRAVRRGDWKLVKYESPVGGLATQLFNLKDNPHEFIAEHREAVVTAVSHATPDPHQKNLADDPAHATPRRDMEALLLAEMRRLDDPYRFSDQPPAEASP